MSRRRTRPRQPARTGFGGTYGATLGLAAAVATLVGAVLAVLLVFFRLWGELGDPVLALVVTVLLAGAVVGLVSHHQQLSRALAVWAARRRAMRTGEWVLPDALEPEDAAWAFQGSTYTFYDSYRVRRYDGRSGDLLALNARIAAHLDPAGGTALSGKVRPGWSWTVETYPTYAQAKEVEATRIARHLGQPGYENKRLEVA